MSTYCNRQNRICGFGGGMNMGSKYSMDDRVTDRSLRSVFTWMFGFNILEGTIAAIPYYIL